MQTALRMAAVIAVCLLLGTAPLRAQSPQEMAPGVGFPSVGGVILLDTTGVAPRSVIVHATEIKSNAHAGGNFARGMVYAGAHSSIELDGTTSALTITNPSPTFFVRLPTDDPDIQRERITLLRLKPTKDTRVVLDFSQNVFGGSRKRHIDAVTLVKTDADGGAWVKITPDKPLPPGEYGITFLPKDQMLFADTVYDFTIAPK